MRCRAAASSVVEQPVSQNIVRMSVYLLLTLGGAAGLYFMLKAEFLAAIQLIVYAGGTLILIVFGVMLTSKNPFMQLRAKPWELCVGLGMGVIVAGLLIVAIVTTRLPSARAHTAPTGYDQIETLAASLLTTYLVPFEVAAVLLLIVMIAAAYMARRRVGERT